MYFIKRKIKSIYTLYSRFIPLFLKSPRFELYIIKKNKLNKEYFKTISQYKNAQNDQWLEPFRQCEIPKVIWMYWAQGEENMPFVVRECVATWKVLNPNWEVRICTDANLGSYLDSFSFPNHLPYRYRANYLRLALIEKFGGVWADSTCFCHRPLDEWLPLLAHSGFFVFRNPAPDRDIENWFICATAKNPLIKNWKEFYKEYCDKLKTVHYAYFLNFYAFQFLLKKHNSLRQLNRSSSGLSAGPSFFMMSYLEGQTTWDNFSQHLKCGLPVSKLSWKSERISEESFLSKVQAIRSISVNK